MILSHKSGLVLPMTRVMFVFRAAIYGFQHRSEISRNPTKNPMELNRKIGVASY